MHLNTKGFSLIELVVFIVVMGIVGTAMVVPLQTALTKSPTDNQTTVAAQLAQGRMEEVLGQRYSVGFTSFTDLCTGAPAVCTKPAALSSYTIGNAGIASTTISGDTDYKIITVTVSGAGNATVQALVADY